MSVRVSDHALVRWLERSHSIDMEGLRDLLAEKLREAVEVGATGALIDGQWFVLEGGTIVTVLPKKPDPVRSAKHRAPSLTGFPR